MSVDGPFLTERDRRLPVPVAAIPLESRLVIDLFDIDKIAVRTDRERRLRRGNEQIIREALAYKPSFAEEMQSDLQPVAILLVENGYIPQTDREVHKEAVEKQVQERLKEYSFRPKPVNPAETARSIARKIVRIVHPDVADDEITSEAFEKNQAIEFYQEALEAAEKAAGERAQQILIETMPRFYLTSVKAMLDRGMSLAEIVAEQPDLIPDMELLRWVAFIRLPKESSYRRFGDPKGAESEAASIKRKSEHHTRSIGYAMVYSLVDDVFDFAKTKGLDPEMQREFESLTTFMQEAGGWVGGTGEFAYKYGLRTLSIYGTTLAKRLEDHIRVLPAGLLYLAQTAVSLDSAPDSLRTALKEFRLAVARVKQTASDYGHEMERKANEPQNDAFLSNSLLGKGFGQNDNSKNIINEDTLISKIHSQYEKYKKNNNY